jgi:hypothetical protein
MELMGGLNFNELGTGYRIKVFGTTRYTQAPTARAGHQENGAEAPTCFRSEDCPD